MEGVFCRLQPNERGHTRLFTSAAALLGAAAILLTPLARAQSNQSLAVNIPFEFSAKTKTYPAGEYRFQNNKGTIEMTSADRKVRVFLPVITSIARSSEDDDHLLAFDKVEGKKVLSEVWLPHAQGAVVSMEKGEHQHELVRLDRRAAR